MAKNSELENAMKRYIDSDESNRAESGTCNRLRELLKNESVNSRYDLLMNVRGDKYSPWTGLHEAAVVNDLESIRYMLDGFPSDKKYDVLKIKNNLGNTPLHSAAYRGYSSIITYLMTDLSQQQKYDIFKIQDEDGDTALHRASSASRVEVYRVIAASVPYRLLLELLNIKNNRGKSAADIRPELKDEFPLSIAHGTIIIKFHVKQLISLKYFKLKE